MDEFERLIFASMKLLGLQMAKYQARYRLLLIGLKINYPALKVQSFNHLLDNKKGFIL